MFENQNIIISVRLKEYFISQNLTQQEIADRLGIKQAGVSKLLNGKPFGKKTAKTWHELFGLNPNWLLTGEGEMIKTNDEQLELDNKIIENNKKENPHFELAALDAQNKIIDSLLEMNDRCRKDKETLEEKVEKLQREIDRLREDNTHLKNLKDARKEIA